MRILIFVVAFSAPLFVNAQCLDGFRKLLPEENATPRLKFARVASGGSWFVSSSVAFDSTGFFFAGAAYVYKRSGEAWNVQAQLTPSNARQQLYFGNQTTMDSTGETIVISSAPFNLAQPKGEIYVFHRPGADWSTMHESERISLPDTTGAIEMLILSRDGLTLAVGLDNGGAGEVWIYERSSASANFGDTAPTQIASPVNTRFFGFSIAVTQHTIIVIAEGFFTPGIGTGGSDIYVYRRSKAEGYPRLAKMKGSPFYSDVLTGVKATDNLITFPAGIPVDTLSSITALMTFQKNSDEQWADTTRYISVPFYAAPVLPTALPGYSIINDSTLAVSYGYTLKPLDFYVPEFGVVTEIKRQGKRWTRSQRTEIFAEPSITDLRFIEDYGFDNVWTGAELLIAPTPDSLGSQFPNGITSLRKTGATWSAPAKVLAPGIKSTNFNFGSSIAREGTNLLISSPQDNEAALDAGGIEVYSKNGPGDWVRTGRISPPPDRFIHDTGFGYVIAAADSMLAVSGTKDIYPNPTSGNGATNGKVFVYKRTGSDWTSASLVQEITPGGSFYNFASSISITGSLLVVAGQDFGPIGNSNSIMIYKRDHGYYSFLQEVQFNNPFIGLNSSATFIRNDTIFSFSGAGVTPLSCNILTRNSAGVYSVASSFALPKFRTSAELTGLSSLSITADQDHVFIGMPTAEVGNVPAAGAIAVFTKPAGTQWPAGVINNSSIIFSKDTVQGQFFGYAVSSIENALMVGAPGINFYYENTSIVTPVAAGAVYTLRATDHEWAGWEQISKFQGTKANVKAQDLMGYAVLADGMDFFACAPYESNANGARAGAVYTLAPPTTIHLVSPLCKGSAPLKLIGYPAGGTWSGSNVDPVSGMFNTPLLDTGRYLVTYTTPECNLPAHMTIHIVGGLQASLLTPASIALCPGKPADIKTVTVTGIGYQWYFEKPGDTNYSVVSGQTSPTLTVSSPGSYYCIVTNGQCTTGSPVTQVTVEAPPPYVANQDVACNLQQPLTLRASPSGGTWSSDHVRAGLFYPTGLPPGLYPVVYNFTSSEGCAFSYNDSVRIAAMPSVFLTKPDGDYCTQGYFALATDQQQPDWNYSWLFRNSLTRNSIVLDATSSPARIFPDVGFYKVVISNKYCSTTTNEVNTIVDSLAVFLSPPDPVISLCKAASLTMYVSSRDNVDYDWTVATSPQGPFTDAGTGSAITILKGGYYRATATLGYCTTVSKIKQVIFLPPDSLFVPNVFTPNGDGHNEILQSYGNVQTTAAFIFNRWGEQLYKAPSLSWDGGGSPAGTYFYVVMYYDCLHEEIRDKGWVELVR